MIETLSSEKTNRHDEHHEECHGVEYCESVQGVVWELLIRPC